MYSLYFLGMEMGQLLVTDGMKSNHICYRSSVLHQAFTKYCPTLKSIIRHDGDEKSSSLKTGKVLKSNFRQHTNISPHNTSPKLYQIKQLFE